MTHGDFITEVAKRLEWPEEKTAGIIEAVLEVISTELKMNNPVVIDDFGTLKTDIQPEYILLDPETKERYLMPPSIEVVFEALFRENEENPLLHADFMPDEALYNDVNSSFSQFEPALLNEGVQFPGIPEIVAEELKEESDEEPQEEPEKEPKKEIKKEPEKESEAQEYPYPQEEETLLSEHGLPPEESTESEIPEKEAEATELRAESSGPVALPGMEESPPQYRSSRGEVRRNKKTLSVWIPIAGGIAIIVASLFFFKRDEER
ncbi:MAG: HU family DNA-binding protein [Proteiniphilum sp.]|jgi:nucleoid DNA-binding protein|nr:HU family DNA-binding protein [Proteiniphilum sp.]